MVAQRVSLEFMVNPPGKPPEIEELQEQSRELFKAQSREIRATYDNSELSYDEKEFVTGEIRKSFQKKERAIKRKISKLIKEQTAQITIKMDERIAESSVSLNNQLIPLLERRNKILYDFCLY